MGAAASCTTSSSAMDDIGDIAQPTQSACFQLAPVPALPSATPTNFATSRAATSASTSVPTDLLQSAWAATTDTSTNISMVSRDEAVPNWRGQAHGRGCNCLRKMPPSSAASGADPPKCAASAVPTAISASSRIEVFSLFGLITLSAERSASARIAPTSSDRPSTTRIEDTLSITPWCARVHHHPHQDGRRGSHRHQRQRLGDVYRHAQYPQHPEHQRQRAERFEQ